MNLNIGPFKVPVEFVPNLVDCGECSTAPPGPKIRIAADLAPGWKELTLLHEALHIISDILDLDLKEQQVRGLEVGLGCLFKDNHTFSKNLLKSLGIK